MSMVDQPEVVAHAAIRVHATPKGWAPDWKPTVARRTSRAIFAIHAYSDERADLGLADFALAHAAAPGVPLRAGFVLPPKVRQDEVAHVRSVAKRLGIEVRSHEEFVRYDLKKVAWGLSSVTVGYGLFETLGLLAVRIVEARRRGGLSIAFKTTRRRTGRARRLRVTSDAWIQRVTIRARNGRAGTARWTLQADKVPKGGPLVDLVTLAHAQSGKFPRSLGDLAASLALAVPEDGRTPEALATQVLAICQTYAKLEARHRSLVGGDLSPSVVTTPGAYGRGIVERTGLIPPVSRPGFLDHDPRILGTMEAYHGPEVVLAHRGEPVGSCGFFDVASQFVQAAIHLGAWRFLAAKRIEVKDLDPVDLADEIDELSEDAITDPRTLRRFGMVFANVVPSEGTHPHRVPGGNGSYTTRVAPFTCPEPVLYNALDLVRARFADGKAPQIASAFRLVPQGKIKGLRPFTLPGAGTFDPNAPGADLFRFLFEGRVRVRSGQAGVPAPWSSKDLATTLKAIGVSFIGSLAQVVPQAEGSRSVEVEIIDGRGDTRTVRTHRPETPGDWFCPPLAAAILAASRLEGFALRRLVETEGGLPLYSATDSVVGADLSPQAAVNVLHRFERLSPTGLHGPRVVAGSDGLRVYPQHLDGPLALRVVPETLSGETFEDKQGERYQLAVPLTFTGWLRMRYVLTDAEGRPVYFSEHGLGDLVDSQLDRLSTEWIGRALSWAAGTGPEPGGLDRPRLVVQAANRPGLSAAVGFARLLRAWSPLVLAFEWNELGFGERMLVSRWTPGFDPTRADWRVFGSGESARHPELQTIRDYLDRYTHTRERGALDAQGQPSVGSTVGPLHARPTVALGLRRVGREAHDVGEWRPGGPRHPVSYETQRVGPSSQSPGVQAFRDACRILRRALDGGQTVYLAGVIDARGKALPQEVLEQVLHTRTAPPNLRRMIVEAAAHLSHAPAGAPEHLVLTLYVCDFPGCARPAAEGGRWCSNRHKVAAYRARVKVTAR